MTTPARRWARRNPLLAGFAVTVFFSMCVGYTEDIQSCRRTANTREAQTHNITVLQQMFMQDADRARQYSAVDQNPAGRQINKTFAAQRAALVASLRVPPVPSCFPIPGV